MTENTTSPTVTRKWKCGCGSLEIELRNDPVLCFDCHCRSCVGFSRFADASSGSKGTSELNPSTGGSAKAFFKLQDISSLHELEGLQSQLVYTKIGPDGKQIRSYTKCCGTPFVTGGSKEPIQARPFNRCAIYNADGTKFQIPKPPNIMLNYAFDYNDDDDYDKDRSSIPNPKSSFIDVNTFWQFLKMAMGYALGKDIGEDWKEKLQILYCDPAEADVIPIPS